MNKYTNQGKVCFELIIIPHLQVMQYYIQLVLIVYFDPIFVHWHQMYINDRSSCMSTLLKLVFYCSF